MPLSPSAWPGGGLASASVTLTDAQIKALPTTAISVVPAPGSGRMVVPIAATMLLDSDAAAYTNLAALTVFLNYGTSLHQATISYSEAAQGAFADAGPPKVLGVFLGFFTSGEAGWLQDRSVLDNAALTVFADNAAAGNLTGGNVANRLTVTVTYQVVAL